MPASQRIRTLLAALLLLAAAVFIAVALSQWLVAGGLDPRDDTMRRAAGMGFTDQARATLFSVVPVAAPAVAVWLRSTGGLGRVIRRCAQILYVAFVVIGVPLALSAASYGFDEAVQLANEGQVFIDTRAAVERLLLDIVWIVLAVAGWVCVRWNGKREDHSAMSSSGPKSPNE